MEGEIIFTDRESVLRFVEAVLAGRFTWITVANRTTNPPLVEEYLVKYKQK